MQRNGQLYKETVCCAKGGGLAHFAATTCSLAGPAHALTLMAGPEDAELVSNALRQAATWGDPAAVRTAPLLMLLGLHRATGAPFAQQLLLYAR